MKTMSLKTWFRIGLVNLSLVALLGLIMRYKIPYDLPALSQKNLLHAHSHFAFAGWISHFLYTGFLYILTRYLSEDKLKKYHNILYLNLFAAYGMLFSFTAFGYNAVSISFSTLSVFVSFIFAWYFIKDLKQLPANHSSRPWAIAALLVNILSCLGPFSLAYMMMSHNIDPKIHLGAVYYYLHFQYSGWFFFGSMAIILSQLPEDFPSLTPYYKVFAITIIPTFFLSILWAKLPMTLYIITIIATFMQMIAWFMLFRKSWEYFKDKKTISFPSWVNTFFYVAALAITMKFILQTISLIPSLSQLVFGIRSIVIAYLHLVLLAVYSLFIIGFMFAKGWLNTSKLAKYSAFAFMIGVLLNELFLGIQGMAGFKYILIPNINQMLLGAAVVLFSSAVALAYSQRTKA